MGNWSVTGIAVTIGLFFVLFGIVLSFINVTNPYTNMETSVTGMIFDWIGSSLFGGLF